MKTLKLLAPIASLVIAGCSSTSEPTVFEKFETNQSDSYARTMMGSAGSNKFIDSEKGENNTREVAGKTAMNVAQLATLDLVGFLTNSALNSQIENEPLSEKTHIFIRVKANSIDEAKSEAVQYLESLIGDSSFTVKDKKEKPTFTEYQLDGAPCETLPYNCRLGLNNPVIQSQFKVSSEYIVSFNGLSGTFASYLGNYADNSYFSYIPVKQGLYFQTYTPKPFVLHNKKAYFFEHEFTSEKGIDINEINFFAADDLDKDGDKKYYKVDTKNLQFTQIKPNTKL